MNGMYARNKLFDMHYHVGAGKLPALEDDVRTDGTVTASVFENYETAIEEGWANFIEDFCGNDS